MYTKAIEVPIIPMIMFCKYNMKGNF